MEVPQPFRRLRHVDNIDGSPAPSSFSSLSESPRSDGPSGRFGRWFGKWFGRRRDHEQIRDWHQTHTRLLGFRETVREIEHAGLAASLIPHETGIFLEPGEMAIADISRVGLIETTRQPTRYDGGYGGLSFPVLGGLRLEAGRQRGRLVRGDESLEVIDTGRAVVTTTRVLFIGSRRTAEWKYRNLIVVSHHPENFTVFASSDRALNSGIAYAAEAAMEIQFRVELALALATDGSTRLAQAIEADIERSLLHRPDRAESSAEGHR